MNRREMFKALCGAPLIGSVAPATSVDDLGHQCIAVRFGPMIDGVQRSVTVRAFAEDAETKAVFERWSASDDWNNPTPARESIVEAGLQFAIALERAAKL